MRTLLFCALLMPQMLLSSDDAESPGIRSLFSYTETMGLPSQVLIREDLLVLKDGTLIVGSLEEVPQLQYTFGKVPLDINMLELLSEKQGSSGKWTAKLKNGAWLLAPLAVNSFTFKSFTEDRKGGISREMKKIAASDVDFILLKPRNGEEESHPAFQLTFANGDILPVDVVDREIVLMDGTVKKVVNTERILNLWIESSRIHGEYLDQEKKVWASATLAMKSDLTVLMPHYMGTLRIPLNNISALSKNLKSEKSAFMPQQKIKSTEEFLIPEIAFLDEIDARFPVGLQFNIADVDFDKNPESHFKNIDEIIIADALFEDEDPLWAAGVDFELNPEGNIPGAGKRDKENKSEKDSIQFLAVGTDFELTPEGNIPGREGKEENREDAIQFLAVGTDFELTPEGNIPGRGKGKEETPGDTIQFLALGTDFELTPEGNIPGAGKSDKAEKGDAIQFISDSEKQKGPSFRTSDIRKGKEYIAFSDYSLQGAMHTSHRSRENFMKEDYQKNLEPYDGLVYVKCDGKNGCQAFYIQSKKVTNQEYKKFVDAVNYKPPMHWVKGEIPPHHEGMPVVNITYKDAFLYAVWLGKRLPTQKELLIASNEKETLKDKGDGVNEWTGTPYLYEERAYNNTSIVSANIGVSLSSQHVIFGEEFPGPMKNQEFNSKTGFRLAAYAQ